MFTRKKYSIAKSYFFYQLTFLLFCGLSVSVFAEDSAPKSTVFESANWYSGSEKIVVGGDYNFPPYEYLDKEGKPTGYNVEITRAIADIMGINIDIVLDDWDVMREAMNTGEVHVLQGMTITQERQKTITFSPPNVRIQQSIFARSGTDDVSNLDDMRGKEIIVQSQGSMHDYLSQNGFDDEIVPVITHVDALRLLASGQHDYAIVANLPGLFLGKELGLSNIKVVGKPFSARGYTYAVKKGNERVLAQFSEGLAILKNTGRQQEIYDKWLGVLEGESTVFPWQQFGLAGLLLSFVLLLVTGVVTFWNRSLKVQVDKRTAELHDHQKQLIQADKMSSLGVLVSGVAHEINNPTSLLLLNLPLLKDAWGDAQIVLDRFYEEHQELQLAGLEYERIKHELPMLIDDMNGGANRIKRIVEDLKDFSRQDAEELDQWVDCNTVVQAAIRLVENSIRKSTDRFSVIYSEDLPFILGSAQRIEQVVVNLLLNACQALESHDQAVAVKVINDQKNKQIQIIVYDEGCGIDTENMSRLMDPFFTTKRERGGTGLGLSVSESIATAHGGHLSFSSQASTGTQATLVLPVVENEDSNE